MTTKGTQVLELQGLRFDARLGILDHERESPQPIRVDAELNLGTQPLLPEEDSIQNVLDYRKVRRIIIEECRSEHVNLLETLIGRLSHRLMLLPGVVGVRVRIVKLEIFEDCEVAIRMESGLW
jgi:7,8-dihydroneopterin aldolase/epimerase/oxygenase